MILFPALAADSGGLRSLPPSAAHPVDFAREVRPIFERHCVECHGPKKAKSGWRADVKTIALTGGESSAPNIVPGNSAGSPLIRYVAGLEEDMQMPQKGDPLTPLEIGLLRAWIDQGAAWPDEHSAAAAATATLAADPLDWWSLRPLRRPVVPAGASHPIDAFVRDALSRKKLGPSREADRRTLYRRLAYDLTGLPPSPEEIDAFVADGDPRAYEKLVDRLLASPRYGERWARHWLDVVRYGETHGYDKDKPRPNAWPYRDYVVRAFNDDKPFGRFVQEQIAGDVLFPGTRDGVEALGFLAAGPWDFIGHVEVPESKIDGKAARNIDRDDMVSNTLNTFASMTVQCARCHDHKFDKFIAQEDYYRLQAVFAALDRTDVRYDADPALARQRAALVRRQQELTAQRDAQYQAAARIAGEPLAKLEQRLAALQPSTRARKPASEAFGYQSKPAASPDTTKWVQLDLGRAVAVERVALLPARDDLNDIGDGFGFPVRFKVELSDDSSFVTGVTVIGERTDADFKNPRLAAVAFEGKGQSARYVRVTATRLAERKDDYFFALAEITVEDAMGEDLAPGIRVSASDSLEAAPRWRLANLHDGVHPGARAAGNPATVARLTAERDRAIATALDEPGRAALAAAGRELAAVDGELAQLPPPREVYAGAVHTGTGSFTGTGADGGKPRPIHVLHRGDVTSPRQLVGPGVPAILPGAADPFARAADGPEGQRRAALAQWLTDVHHPLTWRSIVNRVWHYHFGHGLVDTPNDFGRMGQPPSHPELLDWLAVEFRDQGQSFKTLHRLIVTSATYRQVADAGQPEARADASRSGLARIAAGGVDATAVDADNRLLWRMNRRKLEAEAVRDTVLAVAGKLDLTMGGPSFMDFVIEQPQHSPHYQYGQHDPEDPKSHRRSVYRLVVRSQPQPFLTTLDCADPAMSVDKRNESASALQALALLNNPFMVSMARHFAARLEREVADPPAQIERGFRLALGRAPRDEEAAAFTEYTRQYGLAAGCRLIFSLNEFVFLD